MHFRKLRLAGFKSFVEPTELLIEPGVTGIVGPNGCGKSNIVEALQWVMGETSPRQMRGGEMDDVIFGGTANRPARNVAEVSILLDNSDRDAPARFNDTGEIEVSRRIERGAGSTYRINGQEVRARDVQLLFADLATGAHSTALVTQGRIGALIAAKATDRRALLEEAAGITGLHSRRHEAELRLRAAETNLERLEDVIAALEGQYQGLKRQARQAARYRRLADHIRRQEALLLHLRWREAVDALEAAERRLADADAEVARRTAAAGEAATAQAEAAAALPALRRAEAEAAAELQRLTVARRELDAEEQRIADGLSQIERRLEQIAIDIRRETALGEDAEAALSRLAEEESELAGSDEGDAEACEKARRALASAEAELETREQELDALTEAAAASEAERAALSRRQKELSELLADLASRRTEIEQERRRLAEDDKREDDMGAAREAIVRAERSVAESRSALEAAETAAAETAQREAAARRALQAAETERARLAAEAKTLSELLEDGDGGLFPPLVDAVVVTPGYETALGAALDDDLSAPLDTAAPIHWTALPPIADPPPLPPGTVPLSRFVKGPAALDRRLAMVGIVDDPAEGRRLQERLRPGQRIVSREGALWRWDGYTVSAGARTVAATRLSQRNRLEELRRELAEAEAKARETEREHAAAEAETKAAREAAQAARAALERAFEELAEAREAQAARASAAADLRSRLAALAEAEERLAADIANAERRRTEAERRLAELDEPDEARARIDSVRKEVLHLRAIAAERRAAYERLLREREHRAERRAAIAAETESWRHRAAGAAERLAELAERRAAAEDERRRLAQRPAEIEAQRKKLLDAIETAEIRLGKAADRVVAAEEELRRTDAALKRSEAELAAAREERVRSEALVEQARHDRDGLAERIGERIGVAPEALPAEAGIEEDSELPEREVVETRLERLLRERERMGPVNLRAEQELAELDEQITGMQTEREDLLAAIARLRQGIASLNREGRERLLAAFEEVNAHFQELFVRLFGGGRAHLALTEAEDPLEAGLEIMASPPGKKLQVLSLLSGGEQALTALALLFAVFLTNPAPICVLDEVDAPLDDANVERFCQLLEEIAHSARTRFLVVTHHRITMARVDRLFGVTMGEQGVSQLVSVDLRTAETLRETA